MHRMCLMGILHYVYTVRVHEIVMYRVVTFCTVLRSSYSLVCYVQYSTYTVQVYSTQYSTLYTVYSIKLD